MKIRVVRSGGLGGMRREAAVDTAALDSSRARELHAIVESAEREGLFESSGAADPGERDRFHYRLTIEDGRGTRETRFSESRAPSKAAELIDAVWKASEAARGPGEGTA